MTLLSSDRLAALVLVACAFFGPGRTAALAAPRDNPGGADAITLVISSTLVPGYGKTTIEFRQGDTLVRSTVHNYHNVPTGYRSLRGSFYPVYLVMTGKTHPDPKAFQTVDSILKALEVAGLAVAEDKVQKKAKPEESEPRVRILKLQSAGRKAETPKRPAGR